MIEEMERTGADLPTLREGTLDDAGLARLFADLTCCAEVLEVLEKGAPTAHAREGKGLGALLAGLLEGTVRAAQVRYGYQGEVWSDTILRAPGGFRVVRCLLPSGPAAARG